MKCVHILKGGQWPCGQCLPCLIGKRREWTFRILQESTLHADTVFVTLTYDDDHLPENGTLVPRDLQLWVKKVRRMLYPKLVRFYACGEYGDLTHRPHYHAILYGVDRSYAGNLCRLWGKCSPRRFTVEPLSEASIQRSSYICGYPAKKMNKPNDPRLNGRHPEFARMSLKPGIGAHAMDRIAHTLLTNPYAKEFIDSEGDVPAVLKTHGRSFPTGRYLRGKLREKVGFDAKSMEFQDRKLRIKEGRFEADLSLLREGSLSLEEFDQKQGFIRGAEKVDQVVLNMTSRHQIRRKKL